MGFGTLYGRDVPFGAAAMPAALPIRDDRSPAELRRLARRERDGRVSARLVALADALDGLPREAAARLAGMTGQTLRDWVLRYTAGGLEGLADRPRRGRPCALDAGQQATRKARVLRGPDPARDGGRGWRLADLRRIVHERFGVAHAETGRLRLVKGLNLSRQTARPRHPRAARKAQAGFKRGCPTC